MAALGISSPPKIALALPEGRGRLLAFSLVFLGALALEAAPLAAQSYDGSESGSLPLAGPGANDPGVGAPLSLLPAPGENAPNVADDGWQVPDLGRETDYPSADQALPGRVQPGQAVLGRTSLGTTDRRRALGIEVAPLGEIPLDAIGVLDESQGGFGPNLWHGVSARRATELVAGIPGGLESPTLVDLARRVLLSRSDPPMSLARIAASPSSGSSGLLALRADRLLALGDVQGGWELLQRVPQHKDTATLARARVEAALLSGNQEDACSAVANADPALFVRTFWSKAAIYCHILGGRDAQARLGLDLLRERSPSDSADFRRLAFSVLSGAPAPTDYAGAVDSIDLAMLRRAGQLSLLDNLDESEIGVLHGLLDVEDIALDVRIASAEKLLQRGLLDSARLAALYRSVPFSPEEIRDTITDAENLEGSRGRARIYQAVARTEQSGSRTALLRLALQHAERDGVYFAMARVLEAELRDVDLAAGSVWFAVPAGRALYSLGHFEAASAWMMLGRQEALLNPLAFRAVNGLWPYSRLAGSGRLATDGNLVSWSSARHQFEPDLDPQLAERHQKLLENLFVGLDEADSLLLAEIAEPPSLSDAAAAAAMEQPGRLGDLHRASHNGRLGETVLLSVNILGEDGLAVAPPPHLQAVLKALKQIGLSLDARALAIEAAVVNGI